MLYLPVDEAVFPHSNGLLKVADDWSQVLGDILVALVLHFKDFVFEGLIKVLLLEIDLRLGTLV